MTKPIDPAAFAGATLADPIASPEAAPPLAATEGAPAAPPPPRDSLAFDPASLRWRHDGWSVERQRIFIRVLAETASVHEAADAAGINPRSAYRLRLRPGAESFDAAWRTALQIGIHRLTTLAFERAINGSPRAVWHKGEQIGVDYVPSDRLLMFLLKHFDRSRYGNLSGFLPCDVPDPVGEARDALPQALDRLTDQAPPDQRDEKELFTKPGMPIPYVHP